MQLIGLLRSPFVRRVAISLKYYGIPFEHYPLSTFEDYDTLATINPVVKVPTLVLDNGEVLMDSSLILEYFESVIPVTQKLLPTSSVELARNLRIIGLALMACEKTVQLVYEKKLRPEEKQHQPWIERVTKQINGAFKSIEDELIKQTFMPSDQSINQASISVAVAWTFNQQALPNILPKSNFPMLSNFTDELEALPIFIDTPTDYFFK